MKLNDTARQLLGSNPATLVAINPNGSSQVSVVWIVVQRTDDGDDELVTAHLADYQKLRNIRRDPRVAVTVVSTDRAIHTVAVDQGDGACRGGRRTGTARRADHADVRHRQQFPAARRTARIPDSHHDRQGRRRGPVGDLNMTASPGQKTD
jgi:hypothetical protein